MRLKKQLQRPERKKLKQNLKSPRVSRLMKTQTLMQMRLLQASAEGIKAIIHHKMLHVITESYDAGRDPEAGVPAIMKSTRAIPGAFVFTERRGGMKNMTYTIRSLIRSGLDLIYPPGLYCICCGKIIDTTRTYRLCNDCMEGMKWIDGRTCRRCGRQLSVLNPGEICFNCREHPHSFDTGYTCTEYGTHERAIVFSLKYDGRTDIAPAIGEIMADRIMAEFSIDELKKKYDLVLPVPVHRSKRLRRGYNQADLIAEEFCRRTGLHLDDDILVRTRETHIMRSLGPDARRENIRGAFAVRKRRLSDIEGRNILLTDDIYTTGATVDELARVLKDNGAARTDFLAFAAGADIVKSF